MEKAHIKYDFHEEQVHVLGILKFTQFGELPFKKNMKFYIILGKKLFIRKNVLTKVTVGVESIRQKAERTLQKYCTPLDNLFSISVKDLWFGG